jgi:hypothetical protein
MAAKARPRNPGKPRKPASRRKGEVVRLRLAESLKRLAIAAAEKDDLDISAWLRGLIVRRAKELGLVAEGDVPDET